MESVLEIAGLEKNFGSCKALCGIDMVLPAGQIVGLLGPNTSGKTTFLKTVAGLLSPSAGYVGYYGKVLPGPAARETVSFCPDTMVFPKWMRVRDGFTFYHEMYSDYSLERADELMRILELKNFYDTHINRLTKGMTERLTLALTLSRETKVYLLDEPLDGIDPVGKNKVLDAIISMRPQDASILVSTHMVKDTERIFDNVYFLSKGKIIFFGNCQAVREERGISIEEVYLEVFNREGSF